MSLSVLSIFDNSSSIKNEFIKQGCKAHSLDISPGHNGSVVDYVCDILEFDYKKIDKNYYNFLFIALPCDVYSIASGGKHFKNNIPVTCKSIKAINILVKIFQITKYFDCNYLIENPSGGLVNNSFFKNFFNLEITRITFGSFGYPTQKKTDLFHNFNMLFISNPVVRVNNRYTKQKLCNMSYRNRVHYPSAFVVSIVETIIKTLS